MNRIHKYIIQVFIVWLSLVFCISAFAAFPTDWGRKCPLVIQANKVDSNQSDFPVLLTKDTLPSEMFDADGSYPALNGGGDIRFSSDSSGSTQLACEIVTFSTDNDPANGVAEIWVKVPSISSSTNTTIYIWYNKSGETQPVSSDTYGSENVWDSNFVMAQHMGDATTSSVADSTSNANDGTKLSSNNPVEANAIIGKGQNFDGVDDYVDIPTLPLSNASDITVSVWINRNSLDSDEDFETVVSLEESVGYFRIDWSNSDNTMFGYFNDGSHHLIGATAISVDVWYHVVYSKSGSNFNFYVGGVLQGSDTGGSIASGDGIEAIGTRLTSGNYESKWNGMIDEVRVSNTARSADWIKAEYNNQNDPSTFVIEGTPESLGFANLKSVDEILKVDIMSIGGVAIGDIKSVNGIE